MVHLLNRVHVEGYNINRIMVDMFIAIENVIAILYGKLFQPLMRYLSF